MPILAREVDLYPESLLNHVDAGNENNAGWWAIYTLSRREKEAMRRFESLEIPFYGPLITKRGRSPAGRVREAYIPLFSNYVFIYGDEYARSRALTTNCVSRALPVPDEAALIRDLRQIYRLIQAGEPLTPELQLEAGVRVRICSGSLCGMEGTVIKRAGTARILVAVDFLKQGASLLLEDLQVERLD